MSTSTLTGTERTCYEVVFGPDEADRQTYTDYGDGSFISQNAEVMATREFLRLSALGVPCGFCVNGVLTAGEDIVTAFIEAIEASERAERATVEHKTRTSCPMPETGRFNKRGRKIFDKSATAICACGWIQAADRRDLARAAARHHRETLDYGQWPYCRWHGEVGADHFPCTVAQEVAGA